MKKKRTVARAANIHSALKTLLWFMLLNNVGCKKIMFFFHFLLSTFLLFGYLNESGS